MKASKLDPRHYTLNNGRCRRRLSLRCPSPESESLNPEQGKLSPPSVVVKRAGYKEALPAISGVVSEQRLYRCVHPHPQTLRSLTPHAQWSRWDLISVVLGLNFESCTVLISRFEVAPSLLTHGQGTAVGRTEI